MPQRSSTPRSWITPAVGLTLTLVLAGCGASTVSTPASAPVSTPVSAPASAPVSASPRPSASGSTAGVLVVDESAARSTVTVARGSRLQVVLHSTYWSVPAGSPAGVLRQLGLPQAAAGPAGPSCHPGSGCGTVRTEFLALTAGTTTLTATRHSCGEAMACAPAQREFRVTVVVTAAG